MSENQITTLYERYILGRPRSALAVLLALFAFFGWHARDFKLDASTDTLILESDEDLRTLRQVNKRYATREFLVVTFTFPPLTCSRMSRWKQFAGCGTTWNNCRGSIRCSH